MQLSHCHCYSVSICTFCFADIKSDIDMQSVQSQTQRWVVYAQKAQTHTHTHTYTTSEWVIGVSVCHCVKQIHAEIASKWHRTLQLCSLYVYLLLRHVACVWMCVSVCVPACVFPLPFARCVTVWVRSHERSSAAVMRITASEYKKKKKNMLGGRQHEHSLKHIWPLLTMGSPR